MNLKKTLDEMAVELAKKASHKDTPIQESTDAFKALTAYYSAQQKNRKKSETDEEPDEGGFSFAQGLGGPENGGSSKVSARRNS